MYNDILEMIQSASDKEFETASKLLEEYIVDDTDFIGTLKQIGTIPETIIHDSTAEKLFSKASDAVLSRAFREVGLKSTVLKGRNNSADVLAESPVHGYTLVADAKAFRLSRTAKNQKDFKVTALSGWRKDADYAVLCSPYFQYPSKHSQIYAQALNHNVCLLSWEHLIFLIENGIKETPNLSFAPLWNFCELYSHKVVYSDKEKCFMQQFNSEVLALTGLDSSVFSAQLSAQIKTITERGNLEKSLLEEEIKKIKQFSHEKAIEELIKDKKLNEKIEQIDKYKRRLRA